MATLHVEYKVRGDSDRMAAMDRKIEAVVGTLSDDSGVFSKPEVDEKGAYYLRELNFPGLTFDFASGLLPRISDLLGADCVFAEVGEEDE